MSFRVPEKFRVRTGPLASTAATGNAGAFDIRLPHSQRLFCIASDGDGWEHVSVSRSDRCPTWEEMSMVKSMFWHSEDRVVQFHPPESEHINNHTNCLHLWRPVGVEMPSPPTWMVGVKA